MYEKLGFIGAGSMAEALVKGLLASGTVKKKDITVSDTDSSRLTRMKNSFGVDISGSNTDVAQTCDILIIAVKPSVVPEVLNEVRSKISAKKIYVSIAAGISTSFIRSHIKKDVKLVRVMPNTPCLVLEGICGIYFPENIDSPGRERILQIFGAVGKTEVVTSESYLDAVTGLSGSGPAFVSLFVEALADGGVKMGLSRNSSLRLAAQTVLGTARMITEAGIKPSDLKDMVSSPAGTTIEGIHKLEEKGFRDAVISAVESATVRSREISSEGDN